MCGKFFLNLFQMENASYFPIALEQNWGDNSVRKI